MELTLIRYCYGPDEVLGLMKVTETNTLWTVEKPWRDNQIFMSCIPDGSYPLVAFDSEDHPNSWVITPVPGRTGILIHAGNSVSDVAGCIAPGLTRSDNKVWNSKDAMRLLNYLLNRNEQHIIHIGPGMGARLEVNDSQAAGMVDNSGNGSDGGDMDKPPADRQSDIL